MNNRPTSAAGNDAAPKAREAIHGRDPSTPQDRRNSGPAEHGSAGQLSADYLRALLIRGTRSACLPTA